MGITQFEGRWCIEKKNDPDGRTQGHFAHNWLYSPKCITEPQGGQAPPVPQNFPPSTRSRTPRHPSGGGSDDITEFAFITGYPHQIIFSKQLDFVAVSSQHIKQICEINL